MLDDLLLQEIYSLREKLKIAVQIVKYYEPDLDVSAFMHDIGTCDYEEYIDYIMNEDNNKK